MNLNRATGLISLIFVCLSFLIPPFIPVHLSPEGSFWNEWVAGVLIILAWGVAWFEFSRSITFSKALGLWVIWGVVLLISASVAHYSMISAAYMVGLFWIIGCLCLFTAAAIKVRFGLSSVVHVISVVLLFSGIAQSILAIARFYGFLAYFSGWLAPIRHVTRLAGLFNYPTIQGFSIWLSVAALVHLFWKRRIGWPGLIIGMAPMACAIVATGDRSSVLYFLTLLCVGVIAIWRQSIGSGESLLSPRFTHNFFGTAAVGVMLLLALPAYNHFDQAVGAKLGGLGYIDRHTVGDKSFSRGKSSFWGIRGSEFRKALYLSRKHFWLGVGPGNYPYQSFRLNSILKGTVREGTVNTHSHNIFSMILAEEGIAGIVVLVLAMILLGRWWWRQKMGPDAFLLGTVLGLFFVFSNLEYPLWYLNFFIIFMFFCGLLAPTKLASTDHGWVKPLLAAVTLIVGGGVALNMANGFREISAIAQRENVTGKDLAVLSGWSVDRFMAPYALLIKEKYVVPLPQNAGHELLDANRMMYHLPMPKAMLDKAIILVFEGHDKAACTLVKKVAYSYPRVNQQYQVLMDAYKKLDAKLPGDPEILKRCIDAGAALGQQVSEN